MIRRWITSRLSSHEDAGRVFNASCRCLMLYSDRLPTMECTCTVFIVCVTFIHTLPRFNLNWLASLWLCDRIDHVELILVKRDFDIKLFMCENQF